MAKLGAHVSAAGGVSKALSNAAALGCDALQVFVKNANRWQAKPLERAEIERFKEARTAQGCPPVVAHASYLINLAATNPEALRKSRVAFGDELERCHALGIEGLVLHPGAHLGRGEGAGLEAIVTSLDEVLETHPHVETKVLLENTAGQGTVLGGRFEHLAKILDSVNAPERLGVCLDTCHAFAAGYNVRDNYEEVMAAFWRAARLENFGLRPPQRLAARARLA